MRILGISCYYHDAAAALIQDGLLIAAAEEERFTRKKHDSSFPFHAIHFCLETGKLHGSDLDFVVFYEKPMLKFERILLTSLQMFPRSSTQFRHAMRNWMLNKLWIKTQIEETLGISADKILFTEHHLSHAASAFFCSPFEEAAILTVDGVGEWTTTMMSVGKARWNDHGENDLHVLSEVRFPHSLGLLYSAFTAFLGFEVNDGEYKVMGMAPYGSPRYTEEVWRLIRLGDQGSFQLDMNYFSYHYSVQKSFTRNFEQLFGSPRKPLTPFLVGEEGGLLSDNARLYQENQRHADIAASIQHVTEEVLLTLVKQLYEKTGMSRLCLAGGVAYNSVANGRIIREGPFKEVFIQPAAGDSGGALGAALYAYHVLLNQPRRFVMNHTYWGMACDDQVIEEAIQCGGFSAKRTENTQSLIREIALRLVQGQVVGWFQGRAEWGPRALGNRSILADPRRKYMKAIVNRTIKFREPFRPFAPSILDRRALQFAEYPKDRSLSPAHFMLAVCPVAEIHREAIPAVTHVDGTTRPHIVEQATNPLYYSLIEHFEAETSIPAVLNTSFNLKGEPIVNSPKEAIATFSCSEMDALAIGPYILEKGDRTTRT